MNQHDTSIEIVKLGENVILSLEIKNYSSHIIIGTETFSTISSEVDKIMNDVRNSKRNVRTRRANTVFRKTRDQSTSKGIEIIF